MSSHQSSTIPSALRDVRRAQVIVRRPAVGRLSVGRGLLAGQKQGQRHCLGRKERRQPLRPAPAARRPRRDCRPCLLAHTQLAHTQHQLSPDSWPIRSLGASAGEGSDAIRLSLLGYDVDAVELSSAGAKKIEAFAEEAGVKVHVFAGDIQDFTPEGPYDVIICNGVLHYIEDKCSVIELMQNATWPGGINVISLWSTYTPVPDCHEIVPIHADDEWGLVTSSYASWRTEFIYFERDKAESAHSDLPGHRHSHIKLIASKPMT